MQKSNTKAAVNRALDMAPSNDLGQQDLRTISIGGEVSPKRHLRLNFVDASLCLSYGVKVPT